MLLSSTVVDRQWYSEWDELMLKVKPIQSNTHLKVLKIALWLKDSPNPSFSLKSSLHWWEIPPSDSLAMRRKDLILDLPWIHMSSITPIIKSCSSETSQSTSRMSMTTSFSNHPTLKSGLKRMPKTRTYSSLIMQRPTLKSVNFATKTNFWVNLMRTTL